MNWKSWPYWIKGGMIGSFIYAILALLLIMDIAPLWVAVLTLIYLPLAFLLFGIGNMLGLQLSSSIAVFLSYVCMVIAGFIIGAVMGYLYGKIKNRNPIHNS